MHQTDRPGRHHQADVGTTDVVIWRSPRSCCNCGAGEDLLQLELLAAGQDCWVIEDLELLMLAPARRMR